MENTLAIQQLESKIDNIEEEIKASSAKKKGIILNEMKKILVKLCRGLM